MVGKIQAKSRRKSRETTGTVAAAEISFLRNNNHELAKALAQTRSDYSQILTERDYLHRELLSANIQIKKLESYLEVIETSTKNAFKNLVASSGDITKTIQTVLLARKVTRRLENAANTSILHISMQNNNEGGNVPLVKNNSITPTSPQNCKTQAVKPMVDGHVIFRPTINLRRVNEIPREPTEHSTDTRPSSESVHNSSNTLDDSAREETEPQQNTSFRCRSTSTYQRSQFPNGILPDEDSLSDGEDQLLQNTVSNDEEPSETESEDKLQTLQEEEEVSDRSNQSETAQLTNTGNPNDVMIGVFTGVKLFTCNPSQNIPEIAEEMNGSGNSTTENSTLGNNETLTRLRMINTHRGTGERVLPVTASTLTDLSVSEADSTVVSRSKGKGASTSADLYLSSTTDPSLPSTSGLTRRSNTKKEESFRLRSSPRNNSTLISGSRFVGTSVDLNDLSQNELSKIHQMTLLGLEPSILRNSTSTPYSPVVNLRRQKVLKKIQETPPSSSSYSPTSEETTLSSSSADTPKRRGKQSKIILKTAQVILKRLPVAKRNSISPVKNERKRKTSLEKKTLTRKSRTSNEVTPKKKRSRARSEIALLSPQRLSNSPIKPRRRLPLKSLKEPSINRKMRR